MSQQLNSNNLEICHAARAQLRGEIVASVSASKIARVLQVLIFTVSCLFASQLPAQDLQTASKKNQSAGCACSNCAKDKSSKSCVLACKGLKSEKNIFRTQFYEQANA